VIIHLAFEQMNDDKINGNIHKIIRFDEPPDNREQRLKVFKNIHDFS